MTDKFAYILLSVLALTMLSCTEKNGASDEPAVPEPEKLGEYFFKDKTYDIHSACYLTNESYYILMFSPLRPQDEKTTVLLLAVLQDHDNVSLDVENYFKNYDYVLRYESPKWFYPETIAPQSGSILVHRISDSEFSVSLDVVLKDGTPLKLDYNGPFTEDTSGESD